MFVTVVTKHDGSKVSTCEFEKPTSAPLIAPIDTITPVPLLYHVRTYHTVRYNFLTTHPSQPTYTINELQKKEEKKKKKSRRIQKQNNHTHKFKQRITYTY